MSRVPYYIPVVMPWWGSSLRPGNNMGFTTTAHLYTNCQELVNATHTTLEVQQASSGCCRLAPRALLAGPVHPRHLIHTLHALSRHVAPAHYDDGVLVAQAGRQLVERGNGNSRSACNSRGAGV
jgi:hypothetical protein